MNKKNYVFPVLAMVCLVMALTGTFHDRAFAFLKTVAEQNLRAHSLLDDMRQILAGISQVQIPFVSGDTAEISAGLEQVESYLHWTKLLSVLQLMFLMVGKSLLLKVLLLVLFVFSFVPGTKVVCSRLLLLALAINPGLSMFTVTVNYITREAAISQDGSSLSQLQQTVDSLHSEKAQLMLEHQQGLTRLSNGEKGFQPFGRLQEDVAFDRKDAGGLISGNYTYLRSVLKNPDETVKRKLFLFAASSLFGLLVLPLGYLVLVLILLCSLLPVFRVSRMQDEEPVNPAANGKEQSVA
jgi:hypothetical protein